MNLITTNQLISDFNGKIKMSEFLREDLEYYFIEPKESNVKQLYIPCSDGVVLYLFNEKNEADMKENEVRIAN